MNFNKISNFRELKTSKVKANYILADDNNEIYLYIKEDINLAESLLNEDEELISFSTFGKLIYQKESETVTTFKAQKVVAGHHVQLDGYIDKEIYIEAFGIDFSFEPNLKDSHKPAVLALFGGWFMELYMKSIELNFSIRLTPYNTRSQKFWERYGFKSDGKDLVL